MTQAPDFDSIKQTNIYGIEYWSARDLMPLLGYDKWERFDGAIKRAMIACESAGNAVSDHFPGAGKAIKTGKGAVQELKDYHLSRFACYLIAQNGDPRKAEIAAAQVYFAVSTRKLELQQLYEEQEKRLQVRERVTESNKKLNEAAENSGVQSKNFGHFHNAGYLGMYTLTADGIREHKHIDFKEDILDVMGRAELAANEFRITQTERKLVNQGNLGEPVAIETHFNVGKEVREAIKRIDGTMPEDLPTEPSIKPLLAERKRAEQKRLKLAVEQEQNASLFVEEETEISKH